MGARLLFLVALASASASDPSFLFLLGDDIGWADFSYNGGTAYTPNIDRFAREKGSVRMHDFHSGGTVCSPTRATVLTGRNHFRDCVNYVYGCSDMTECVPDFLFAPNKTFTVPMAVREANPAYKSSFFGKWHLGSFYNDSEAYGGLTSSPVTHGFDTFNATVEVAPTATTNCNCNPEWEGDCLYGHYNGTNHCNGHKGPGGNNCCFNYWWPDSSREHAVANLTEPVPQDDTLYLTDSFNRFLDARGGDPFFAQISFHNCHIPYIGTPEAREQCANGTTCKPGNYSDAQLDYYACLRELDDAVGRVLRDLEQHGYRQDTMIWFTTDNGPEGNCQDEGYCSPDHFLTWPGSAGPLRGRKRDTWEGGHRVPGIVSWPAKIPNSFETWETIVTSDFLATVLDVLNITRPENQRDWAFDGDSIMPVLLQTGGMPERGIGWMYQNTKQVGYRYNNWKYVHGSKSCTNDDCHVQELYDLSQDLGEKQNVAATYPDVLTQISANFSSWLASVQHSRTSEQGCGRVKVDTEFSFN